MAIASRTVALLSTTLACLIAGCASAGGSTSSTPSADTEVAGGIGACTLPPQLRRLGQNASYLAAGRTIRTTAADCKVRGGQFRGGSGSGAVASTSADEVTIVIGGDAATPACAKRGAVATQGGTLSVRRGPGTGYTRVDSLANGRAVHFCDWSADETWVGVVYPGSGGGNCGVDSPQREPGPYTGKCRTGWISSQYVRVDN
jgi:hypothetical protein